MTDFKSQLQNLFQASATHLLTQMKRATWLHPESHATGCLYRAPDGCKCAIGGVIPDEDYNPSLEGKSALDPNIRVIIDKNFFPGVEWSYQNDRVGRRDLLVQDLQDCHDHHPPEEWRWRLKQIGTRAGLDTAFIDAIPEKAL